MSDEMNNAPAPVGVEGLARSWEKAALVDVLTEGERAVLRNCTRALRALAQQPAAVDDAIGAKLCKLAAEIYSEWDEGNDPRVGKMLRALAEPKFAAAYRADIAELHAALAAQQGGQP